MADRLEDGDLYFLYRPRVGHQRAESLEKVQRLLMVLHPWHGPPTLRLLAVGRKRLPRITEHDRFWAYVQQVVEHPEQLRGALEGHTYQTRTRGERYQPGARPVAEGAYVIARHDGHTHLAYQLESPPRFGPARPTFNIEPEASYVVCVKNPQASTPPGVGRPMSAKAQLPAELQYRFEDRRFGPLDPPEFLDYWGTELVLIGARHDASDELRLDLDPAAERGTRRSLFDELRMEREDRRTLEDERR